ncbi:MAG TPA: hypothetical protein K8U88_01280 [Levilactobacillus hammesii]|uniref:Uncharacterized protein n=1 Tax=Levilactobacillus hammesii TaxID=267633 RepID=A0A921EZR4_9LACO|nr:hypothetical protein [Levilactobacillus hammesii]
MITDYQNCLDPKAVLLVYWVIMLSPYWFYCTVFLPMSGMKYFVKPILIYEGVESHLPIPDKYVSMITVESVEKDDPDIRVLNCKIEMKLFFEMNVK